MNYFKSTSPTNIQELKAALSIATENTKILAGGTDLVISLHENKIKPDMIIDISRMNDIKEISIKDDYVYIGSGVTFSEIEENRIINKYATCLADAAMKVGSPQIRNRATLAGNVANASAAGDGITALVSLRAIAVVMNHKGDIREIEVTDLIIGPGNIAISYSEIIIAIKFKVKNINQKSVFVKIGSRTGVTISKISLSAVAEIDYDKKIVSDITIALGSVGRKSFISEATNERIKGKSIDSSLNYIFQKSLQDAVEESIKGRSSLPYKKEAVKGLAEDLFYKLFEGFL